MEDKVTGKSNTARAQAPNGLDKKPECKNSSPVMYRSCNETEKTNACGRMEEQYLKHEKLKWQQRKRVKEHRERIYIKVMPVRKHHKRQWYEHVVNDRSRKKTSVFHIAWVITDWERAADAVCVQHRQGTRNHKNSRSTMRNEARRRKCQLGSFPTHTLSHCLAIRLFAP